jgi:hypothetical protein
MRAEPGLLPAAEPHRTTVFLCARAASQEEAHRLGRYSTAAATRSTASRGPSFDRAGNVGCRHPAWPHLPDRADGGMDAGHQI